MHNSPLTDYIALSQKLQENTNRIEQVLYLNSGYLLKFCRLIYHVEVLPEEKKVDPELIWMSFEYLGVTYFIRKGNYLDGLDRELIENKEQLIKKLYGMSVVLEREQERTYKLFDWD